MTYSARKGPSIVPCRISGSGGSSCAWPSGSCEALEHRTTLVVEAGTGTGKTFAYLVPALLSGVRVLISTGTRTLQDQLFTKDLPLVARRDRTPGARGTAEGPIELPVPAAHRRDRHAAHARSTRLRPIACLRASSAGRAARAPATSPKWPSLSDSHALWPQITSTRDNCLGQRCEEFSRCHVVAARRLAQEADVVIVNHHLLLADLALKEDGFGDILGWADAVILDEAHQIPDLATQFFGASVSSRRIEQVSQRCPGGAGA